MGTRRFVILSVSRTHIDGLVSKIARLPGLLFAAEPFRGDGKGGLERTDFFAALPDSLQGTLADLDLNEPSDEEVYDAIFSPRSTIELPGVSALGLALVADESPDLFWKAAADPGMKVIVVEGGDRFRASSSQQRSGVESQPVPEPLGEAAASDSDRGRSDASAGLASAIHAGLRRVLWMNGTESIHLYCEELHENEDAFIHTCEFIGAPYRTAETVLDQPIAAAPYAHAVGSGRSARPPDAGAAPDYRIDRQEEILFRLRALLAERNVELVARAADVYALQAELSAVTGSIGWRMTAPIRVAARHRARIARLLRRGPKAAWRTVSQRLLSRLAARRQAQR